MDSGFKQQLSRTLAENDLLTHTSALQVTFFTIRTGWEFAFGWGNEGRGGGGGGPCADRGGGLNCGYCGSRGSPAWLFGGPRGVVADDHTVRVTGTLIKLQVEVRAFRTREVKRLVWNGVRFSAEVKPVTVMNVWNDHVCTWTVWFADPRTAMLVSLHTHPSAAVEVWPVCRTLVRTHH